jgi:hypothetical protein
MTMPQPGHHIPVKLTGAQRRFIAEIVPEFADRLKLQEVNLRTVLLTLDELRTAKGKVEQAVRQADTRMKRDSLPCAVKALTQAIDNSESIRAIPVARRLYQLKITLKDSQPPIWRRIQVKDCRLAKLHEHIQTAMGWTNSHLHHFQIGEQYFGDPMLLHRQLHGQLDGCAGAQGQKKESRLDSRPTKAWRSDQRVGRKQANSPGFPAFFA